MRELEIPPPSPSSFKARARTRWSDEDNQGVLNNAVYLTLFEEARHAWATTVGLLERNRFPFLLAQTHVRFVAPGRGGAEVEIELLTTRVGTSSFEQAYRVRDVERDVLWAEAAALLVFYDAATGKSRAIPPQLRASIVAGSNER